MTKMKQCDAVFAAVINVCGEKEGAYTPDKDQRKQITNVLFEGFKAERIELSKEYDDKKLKNYCSGLLSNWLRKGEELNGGVKYVAKNPGSRAGSTDPSVKAMRLLLDTKTDPADRAEIQAFIAKRVAEIKPTKSVSLTEEQKHVLRDSGMGHLITG